MIVSSIDQILNHQPTIEFAKLIKSDISILKIIAIFLQLATKWKDPPKLINSLFKQSD